MASLDVQRQGDVEGRSLSLVGLEPDAAALPLNQLPAEVQTQSGAADASLAGVVCPREAVEELRLLVTWDADAGIANADHCLARRLVGAHTDSDGAAGGTVLHPVVDEVAEHLLEKLPIPRAADRGAAPLHREGTP